MFNEEPVREAATADKSRMPNPQSRDAPSFDADKPEELLRFINRMEDLFKKHGITGNGERIVGYIWFAYIKVVSMRD